MLDIFSAINTRNSIREYENTEIPMEEIERIVRTAGQAPSSKNTQPWKLFLVRGQAMEAMRNDFLQGFDEGMKPHPDFAYSPNPLPAPSLKLARECGIGIFQHKGIGREDKDKRHLHNRENFAFFGAPHIFVLGVDKDNFTHGTVMDCGFVLNNIMNLLTAQGYGSCPQYTPAAYPDLLRKHIPNSENILMITGLPFGTPKKDSHVNKYQPARLPIEEWFSVVE
ncbi:MAG: hypothetical protein GX801_05740 [Fibrobacter sp.]|nr:hypothetical protein [Fibrobacter sp.]